MDDSTSSPLGLLSEGWKLAELKDISTKIGSGATPRGGESAYLRERLRFALVRSQNVYDRRFDEEGLAFISDEQALDLGGVNLKSGDLLLNITGDGVTFARSCVVPDEILPACVNQHVAIIRLRTDLCLPGYLLSYLTHPVVKRYIESFNAGGSRRAITKGNIESFLVPLPPLAQQEQIVVILNALDDKIELNRRMNQTLEAMTRAIYKSSFEGFDHVDDEQPWSQNLRNLSELATISRGALSPADYPTEDFEHYSLPAFDEGKTPRLEKGAEIKSNKFLIPANAVLLSKLNPRIPRVWLPLISLEFRSICSTEFLVIVPSEISDREFLYSLFCSTEFMDRFATRTTGTSGSHQRVRPDDLLRMEVAVPSVSARKRFSATIRPVLGKIAHNLRESKTLAAMRDSLLPRLLSGEIRVKQAERIVEEIA